MMNRNKIGIAISSIGAVVLLMLSGCATKEQPVLAKVDDWVVTPAEFNKRLERLPEQFRDIVKNI